MAEQNNLKENMQRPKKIQYKNDPTNNRGNQSMQVMRRKLAESKMEIFKLRDGTG